MILGAPRLGSRFFGGTIRGTLTAIFVEIREIVLPSRPFGELINSDSRHVRWRPQNRQGLVCDRIW